MDDDLGKIWVIAWEGIQNFTHFRRDIKKIRFRLATYTYLNIYFLDHRKFPHRAKFTVALCGGSYQTHTYVDTAKHSVSDSNALSLGYVTCQRERGHWSLVDCRERWPESGLKKKRCRHPLANDRRQKVVGLRSTISSNVSRPNKLKQKVKYHYDFFFHQVLHRFDWSK